MNNKLKTAFTLIELLVVIAIVGILSGLIIVGMSSSVDSARIAKSQIFSASLRDSLLMSLAAEWKMDDASGTAVVDSWSNGSSGMLYNFADTTAGYGDSHASGWMSASNCILGTCLKLDGVDDYVNLGNGTNLQMPDAVTIDIWINFNNLSAAAYILSKRSAWNDASGYSLIFDKATVNGIEVRGRVNNYARAGNANLVTNKWYNIVGTLNDSGSANKIYIDSVNVTTSVVTTETLENNALNLILGANSPVTGNWLNARIDGIRIYNAIVPTSQIKEQYYAGIARLLAKRELSKEEYMDRLSEL